MRLFCEDPAAFARALLLAHRALVLGEQTVAGKQQPRGVAAFCAEIGRKVDEAHLPLDGAHRNKAVHRGEQPLLFAPLPSFAVRADGISQLLRKSGGGIPLSVLFGKSRLDLAEEGRDFIQPFPDGAAAAVDGNARQRPFAVKEQRALGTAVELFGQGDGQNDGNKAGGEGEDDARRALRIQPFERHRGGEAQEKGERRSDAPVGGKEQGGARTGGKSRHRQEIGVGEAEGEREHDGEGHRGGVFQKLHGKQERRERNGVKDGLAERRAHPRAQKEPQKGDF